MKQNTFDKKDGMLKKHNKKRFWKKAVAMLSCVTVFCTSYTMIMPAMTMSETTYCGQEEGENHTHTLQCYSNPNADLETEANWTATIPTLTGNWNEDVVAVANSQLGYQESTANYQVADNNEKKGYNRYGAWMNEPYADWNTDFVLFCLHYANVDTNSLSLSNDLSAWASNSAYVTKDSYTPKAGDLIILDENNDGSADHAAIITEANGSAIEIVEGDYNNAVGQENYDTTDARVVGYIQMPSNPALPQPETPEETAAPVETSAPEETAQPEPTAAPEATEPAETAEPQETVEQEMTAAPEESSAEAAVPAAPSASKRMMPKIFRTAANSPVDITGNLTSATIKIDGQDVTEGPWNVKANNSYDITLRFAENEHDPQSQFPNDATWMTYPIPKGLEVADLSDTTFDMEVKQADGKTIKVSGNKMVVDKATRRIKLQWNQDDLNFQALVNSTNLYVDVNIHASFDAEAKEINFSGSVVRTVNVDSTHNASVSKTGWYDSNDGKIHYTVTVNSTGTSKDVVVTDTITGTALKYDQDQKVKITSTKGATATMEPKGNGFTATIPSMSDGEQVKFEYTASVNFDKLNGSITESETSNGVRIKCKEDSNPNDNSVTQSVTNISVSSVSKYAKGVGETYPDHGRTYRDITWNINANPERKKHITYISDSINPDSQGIMTYSGEGLEIVVTKADGTKEDRTVKWDDKNIEKSDTGWKYTPPTEDGNASYQVTYKTKADVTNLNGDVTVKNNAATDNSSATGNASVGPKAENKISGSKVAEKVTEDEVTWAITVNVPAKGLDSLVVTDTLPNAYTSKQYYDSFGKINSVEGLDGKEAYAVDSKSDSSKFVMTFYKDKDHQNQGMNSSTGNRTITIRFTTKNNKEWMKSAEEPNYSWAKAHINNATIQAPGVSTQVSDKAFPSMQKVEKKGSLWTWNKYTDSNNQEWQLISYDITLSGVTEDNLVLKDTFDTKYLEHYDKQWDADLIFGEGQDNQGDGRSKVTVTKTNTGIEINTGKLPRQSNGSLYGYYRIHYYLKIKLNDLQKLAVENGGTKTLSNSVQWGTKGAKADVTYTYPGVTKTCTLKDNVAFYTIDVNPSALELNGGKAMDLVDTFTDQVVDYSTIDVTATDSKENDKKGDVSYDFSGNTGTFHIPDCTHVIIKYQARPIGKPGSTVTMTNTAVMKTYHSDTSNKVTISGSASGGGSVTSLKLMKYAANNMQTKLPGAEFQLFDEDGNALTYDGGNKKGHIITFTTDKDGYVYITLSVSEYSLGLETGKTYKLKEITAPDGYQVAEGYIPFTISDDGSVDPAQNLYVNGGTIKVADKKITKVNITLKKVDSGNNEKSLQGAVFDLYGSDYAINTSAKAIKANLTTGENGTVELETLESGTYYLVERQAPEGYGKEKDPIKLIVQDDKVTVIQGESITDNKIVDDDSKTQTATVTVTDDAAYNLPKTGGSGTTMIYIAGGVLVAVAVVMFVMQKRKRG